jgi:hypothetical protein
MRRPRLRTLAFALLATAGLSACAEDYGRYGYSSVSLGYGTRGGCDPYYYDCRYYGGGYGGYGGYGAYGYGADPYWGWWGNYYYPGIGFYIYDSYGRRYAWNDQYRRYWEGRRGSWGNRNWNDSRMQRWDGYRRGGTGGTWQGHTGGTWQGRTGTRSGGGWSHGATGSSGGHRGH